MCILNMGIVDDVDILNLAGNMILGVVQGHDDYKTWSMCFADIWRMVNDLERKKKIVVDGQEIEIELFLGAFFACFVEHHRIITDFVHQVVITSSCSAFWASTRPRATTRASTATCTRSTARK